MASGGIGVAEAGPAPPEPAAPPLTARRTLPVSLRLSSVRDIRPLVEMYMELSPEARRFYHPFPFDRSQLWIIYGYMVLASRLARATVRMFPHWSVILIVVVTPGQRRPVGYGTVRFVGDRGSNLRAKMGFTVAEGFRGMGVGTALLKRMIAASLSVGVTRAVGTILRANAASLSVAKKFGGTYQERPDTPDRFAPGEANVVAEGDLTRYMHLLDERDQEAAARRAARRNRPSTH